MRTILLTLTILGLSSVLMADVNIGGGFIYNTGVGGLFTVNSISPTTVLNGEISVSSESGVPAVWVWIDGNRYEFTLTLNNPANDFVLLETGDFMLQEDGTSKVALE